VLGDAGPTRYLPAVISPRSGDADGPAPLDELIRLTTTPIGSAVVVTVAGEVDLRTAPRVAAALQDALASAELRLLVVDLSEVTFLGSSGIAVLVDVGTGAHSGDRARPLVRMVAPPGQHVVTRPWAAMNLTTVLPLHPDVGAALDA
jgi:anti-sigma B factor antagonist